MSLRRVPLHLAAALACGAALAGATPASADAAGRVMILGDSISQGAAGDVTWRYRLWQSLQAGPAAGTVDLVGTHRDLFNYADGLFDGGTAYADPAFDQDHESHWGLRLQTAASSVTATLAAAPQAPDAIIVELGVNDASGGVARADANMRLLIARARAVVPGIDVVLLSPYATWNQSWSTWNDRTYALGLQSALTRVAADLDSAEQRVVTMPLAPVVDARSMTWDGRHPTPTGELRIAAAAAEGLAQLGIGDGPHLPASAAWPATAGAPSVTPNGRRAIVEWPDATPGALQYRIDQRVTSASGSVGAWTTARQLSRVVRSWTSGTLTAGRTYEYRIVPVRKTMIGTPGPATAITVPTTGPSPTPAPAPAPTPSNWWSWFWPW